MEESYFLRISARTVTLTLEIGTQTYRTTLWVMMTHQHSKFHYNS